MANTDDAPHSRLEEFAADALGADIDLVEQGNGKPARSIFIVTAGAGKLALEFRNGDVENMTGLVDGTMLEPTPTYVVKIKNTAGTDCDLIRVGW